MAPTIRFTAQFDDIELPLEMISGSMPHAYQKTEFAGIDGAEFTDMGLGGKVFTGTVWFINEHFDDYFLFVKAAARKDIVHNFVHPVHGFMFGIISSINDRFDSKKRVAVVDFTFEEQLQGEFSDRHNPLITPQIEEQFIAGQQETIAGFRARIAATLGPDAMGVINKVTDTTTSFSAQFVTASRAVRAFVADVDNTLALVDGFLANVVQPANTLIANIDYGVTLPGRFLGSIANAIDRYSSVLSKSAQAPYMLLQSFFTGLTELRQSIPGFEAEFESLRAQAGALLVAEILSNDDDDRGVADVIDNTPSWDVQGNFIAKPARPNVLTVAELERITSVARSYLQLAIAANRDNPTHATMAATILQHVNTIKINRARIITIDIPTPTPLSLICHTRGLGYAAADRVLSLNPLIKNPSFVVGEIQIYDR